MTRRERGTFESHSPPGQLAPQSRIRNDGEGDVQTMAPASIIEQTTGNRPDEEQRRPAGATIPERGDTPKNYPSDS